MTYEIDIRLERKFAKTIKAILGVAFIGQDAIMDKEQATDFLVLKVEPFTVACRLRTYNYYLKPEYRNQFTIRYKLSSGNKTEIHKIREGFGDYILYGFVDPTESKIVKYFIGDLKVFRDYEQGMAPEIHQNKDCNPSTLAAYEIKDFPKEFIIHQYEHPIQD